MRMHTFPLLKFITGSLKIKSWKIKFVQHWAKKLFGSNKLAALGEKNVSDILNTGTSILTSK